MFLISFHFSNRPKSKKDEMIICKYVHLKDFQQIVCNNNRDSIFALSTLSSM